MNSLPARAKESFEKRQGRLDIFSDVFGKDYDVIATTDAHSMVTAPHNYVGIDNVLEGAYHLELLANLRTETKQRLLQHEKNGTANHPDVVAYREQFERTTHSALVNRAPRIGNTVNGNDFYVGITFDGLEAYGVPLDAFSYVRGQIGTLFRIPTQKYFGPREQFRSARVVHDVRTDPRNLELIYHVEDPSELSGLNGQLIVPDQEHLLQLGFVDEFGNTRLRGKRSSEVLERLDAATNAHGVVGLVIGETDEVVRVHRTQENGNPITCLREVPDGKLGMYTNIHDESVGAGYLEMVRKWNAEKENKVDSAHQSLNRPVLGTKIDFAKV